MAKSRNLAALFLLLAVLAAPILSGCRPPWACGFLLALLLGSSAWILAGDLLLPPAQRTVNHLLQPPLLWVGVAGLATLLWASGSYAYDCAVGSAGGRLPALALQNLLSAWAYAAAFLCALRWGRSGRRLRRLCWLVFAAGGLYAAFLSAERWGWGPREVWGWPVSGLRPSGAYTNANRFAVLLALCECCGLGLLAAQLFGARPRHSRRAQIQRVWVTAALLAVATLIASAIAYSLSRLTILSLGLGFALLLAAAIWKVSAQPQPASPSARALPAGWNWPRRRLLMFLAALLASAAVLIVSLSFSGRALAVRLENSGPDLDSRARVWRVGVELLLERPWLGWGQGSFETVFAPRQPLDLQDRWQSAHNDWLQSGIELGLPGLLGLAATALCWCSVWWRGLPPGRPAPGFFLAAGAGLGVFVALVCSAGDFPLREPATAALFFFIAGALAAYGLQRAPRAVKGRASEWRGGAWIAALLLLPGLLTGMFLAGRSGWAAASSPWLGYAYHPAARPEHAAGYRRALEISPRDPALLYPYAQALLLHFRAAPAAEKSAVRAELEALFGVLREVNPRDYRAPWLEGLVLLEEGQLRRATELLDLAVEWAPTYGELRHQALHAHLEFGAGNSELPWDERLPHLHKTLEHMRAFLKAHPEQEDAFVARLKQAGAGALEIVQLWPDERPAAALSRARFWIGEGKLDLAAQELRVGAAGEEETAWHAALRGRVAWAQDDSAGGLAAWEQALSSLARIPDPRLEAWLAQALYALPLEALSQVAERIPAAAEVPPVALAAAGILIREKRWTAASQFLKRHTQARPTAEGFQCWAELSLLLPDRAGALAHAREAYERSPQTADWRTWWEQFYVRAQGEGSPP